MHCPCAFRTHVPPAGPAWEVLAAAELLLEDAVLVPLELLAVVVLVEGAIV